jgi:hypothetical protein
VNPAIYLRVNLPSSCCLQITGVSHDDGVSTTRTGVLAQVEPATTFPVYESAGDGCMQLQKDYGPFDFAEVVDGAGDKRKKEEAEERGRRNRGRSEQSGSSWGFEMELADTDSEVISRRYVHFDYVHEAVAQ